MWRHRRGHFIACFFKMWCSAVFKLEKVVLIFKNPFKVIPSNGWMHMPPITWYPNKYNDWLMVWWMKKDYTQYWRKKNWLSQKWKNHLSPSFPARYVKPQSLKVSHWPSKTKDHVAPDLLSPVVNGTGQCSALTLLFWNFERTNQGPHKSSHCQANQSRVRGTRKHFPGFLWLWTVDYYDHIYT